MSVADEQREGQMEFTHLKFVEFLEFIGRIAHTYFSETSQHFEWGLEEKIEVVLNQMFEPVRGLGKV